MASLSKLGVEGETLAPLEDPHSSQPILVCRVKLFPTKSNQQEEKTLKECFPKVQLTPQTNSVSSWQELYIF